MGCQEMSPVQVPICEFLVRQGEVGKVPLGFECWRFTFDRTKEINAFGIDTLISVS